MQGVSGVTDLGLAREEHEHVARPQPAQFVHGVDDAVGHFVRALVEAVAIVLLVSFVSLGFRAGFVVTLTIPLVLAITFVILEIYGITLQRISLGALIIALGLLVDDAMITVEMMVARLELGDNLKKAATFAYTSTAFPMLTGTLITAAGFLPIATTRGDRLFISLLGSAFINLAWLGLGGAPAWAGMLASLIYAAAVFRWV